jgi:uncharacterized protein DUF4115
MSGENHPRVPFDERPALEELERLQRSIQEYRRKRERAEGDFEQFVGAFRTPAARPDAGAVPESPQRSIGKDAPAASSAAAVAPAAVLPAASFQPIPGSVVVPSSPEPIAPAAADGPPVPPPAVRVPDSFFADPPQTVISGDHEAGGHGRGVRGARGRIPLILGGAAVLVIAAVLLTRSTSTPATSPVAVPLPPPQPSAPAVQTPQAGAATGDSGAVAAPVAPETGPTSGAAAGSGSVAGPGPASGPGSVSRPATLPGVTAPASGVAALPRAGAAAVPPAEIRTVRRVWLRVLVDGNRAVEREVEANASVPLPPGRTFVIRAGDAGAVRFFLKGQDQGPLGGDSQVVTRTFTAQSAEPQGRGR